jgi:hypothetical protein
VGFVREQLQVPGASGKPRAGNVKLLLHLHGREGEPRYRRFVVGAMALIRQTGGGEQIKGNGQLVITGRRLLGLFTEGSHGAEALSEEGGRVACFVFERADIVTQDVGTNWRGKPNRIALGLSSTGAAPADIALDVQVVPITIGNRQVHPSSVKDLIRALQDADELLCLDERAPARGGSP